MRSGGSDSSLVKKNKQQDENATESHERETFFMFHVHLAARGEIISSKDGTETFESD